MSLLGTEISDTNSYTFVYQKNQISHKYVSLFEVFPLQDFIIVKKEGSKFGMRKIRKNYHLTVLVVGFLYLFAVGTAALIACTCRAIHTQLHWGRRNSRLKKQQKNSVFFLLYFCFRNEPFLIIRFCLRLINLCSAI